MIPLKSALSVPYFLTEGSRRPSGLSGLQGEGGNRMVDSVYMPCNMYDLSTNEEMNKKKEKPDSGANI